MTIPFFLPLGIYILVLEQSRYYGDQGEEVDVTVGVDVGGELVKYRL